MIPRYTQRFARVSEDIFIFVAIIGIGASRPYIGIQSFGPLDRGNKQN